MKILIIRNFPSYMSVKDRTYNIQEVGLAKALTRAGHKCDILFWTNEIEEDCDITLDVEKTITIYYRHGITALKNVVFIRCKKLFERYDILQPCEYNQLQSWILAKSFPDKVVIYHGPYYSDFNKKYNLMCKVFDLFFLDRYIKLNTKFITKSSFATDFLISKGIEEKNIKTVGVGIDIEMLQESKCQLENLIYSKMINDDESVKILYIGRLEQRRNIFFILETFSYFLKLKPLSKLYVIGTGEEEYINDFLQNIEKLEIKDQVIWHEKIEQKYLSKIYEKSDFFILPTEYEIFGMVILEAMFYRNVVLTTRNGGSCTLINGNNGFVFSELNSRVWANEMFYCYENKSKINDIKENAHKMIKKNYTWDKLVYRFIEQYKSL